MQEYITATKKKNTINNLPADANEIIPISSDLFFNIHHSEC